MKWDDNWRTNNPRSFLWPPNFFLELILPKCSKPLEVVLYTISPSRICWESCLQKTGQCAHVPLPTPHPYFRMAPRVGWWRQLGSVVSPCPRAVQCTVQLCLDPDRSAAKLPVHPTIFRLCQRSPLNIGSSLQYFLSCTFNKDYLMVNLSVWNFILTKAAEAGSRKPCYERHSYTIAVIILIACSKQGNLAQVQPRFT